MNFDDLQLATISAFPVPKQQQPVSAIERPWAHFAGSIFHNLGTAFQNFGSSQGQSNATSLG